MHAHRATDSHPCTPVVDDDRDLRTRHEPHGFPAYYRGISAAAWRRALHARPTRRSAR